MIVKLDNEMYVLPVMTNELLIAGIIESLHFDSIWTK